jgi:threonylcarbamoyladenosine tRNA methylthiotransferase MtaB
MDGDFRVRISSIEPDGFSDEFIKLFEHPKLCNHLHLCLQSGSDDTLKQMRRFYTVREFREIVERIKTRYPLFNFTTDIIVGFPGETEADFNDTAKLAEELEFSHIHTFKYSVRKGTLAEKMPNHVPDKIKTERGEIIRELGESNKVKYRSQFIGKEQTLLVERWSAKNGALGYGEHYIPVLLSGKHVERNTFKKVKITGISDDKEKTCLAEIQD